MLTITAKRRGIMGLVFIKRELNYIGKKTRTNGYVVSALDILLLNEK